MSEQKSLGEKRVRTDFNVSGSSVVDAIKTKSAELINILEGQKNDEVAKPENDSPEALREFSGEKLRLIALAQTAFEEAAMWAVKAVTA